MIPQIKKILLTTDLSDAARHAFDFAAAVACRQGAAMVILHVMEDPSTYSSVHVRSFLGDERWKQIKESHEDEARQILIGKKREGAVIKEALGEFCRIAANELGEPGLSTDEIRVVRGNVVDEILETAHEKGCDLIVMAHYIRGKLGEAILGSTTRRVLRLSRIPVMLVPIQPAEEQP